MKNWLMRILHFLLEIFGVTIVQIAYEKLSRRDKIIDGIQENIGLLSDNMDSLVDIVSGQTESQNRPIVPRSLRSDFHDVLLVAFDLTGPNAHITQRWLMDNLPSPGRGGEMDEIWLDDWWIANDERFTIDGRDSAVFVAKGNQEDARRILRKHGMVD